MKKLFLFLLIAFAIKNVDAQWIDNFNGGKDTVFYKERYTQSDAWAIHVVWDSAVGTGGRFDIVTSNDATNWNLYASTMRDTISAATGNQLFMDYKLAPLYIGVRYVKGSQTSANIDIYFKQR